MRIPRLQLVELEDYAWFPAVIRDLATDYLRFIEDHFALHHPAVPLVKEAVLATKTNQIVDLCSGGGGPVASLVQALTENGLPVRATLTDRFPNVTAFERAAANSGGRISFHTTTVDARAVPPDLAGLRTLFNAFHHFQPTDATQVLRDAVRAGCPIGIFEIPDRRWHVLLSMMFITPLAVAVATPFIRPFHWRRIIWTYLVPLVPLTCWFDGIVSTLRAYSAAELKHLAAKVDAPNYAWRSGNATLGALPGRLTYFLGTPMY